MGRRALKHKVVVLIPALNEETNIPDVIRGVRRAVAAEIVVIDDVSTDETASIARMEGARVLSPLFRLGAWGATRTGIRYACRHHHDIAVTMDGDGQHLPGAIDQLIEPLLSDHADVVVGSCTERGSIYRKLSWLFFRKITGLDIQDLTSGFRAYNSAAMAAVMSAETALLDYQDIGVLLALYKSGFRVREVPVRMCARTSGHSRVFSSWWKVIHYMAVTLILCISKLDVPTSSRYRSVNG